ncbi:MAG: hypothetical protein KKB82_07895 [Candidatus Omnitrophica bacterium]|nr:hypothetical protein [Candidatus Omnitrophota bacterium]MBU1925825.1 hypothetical protein [Candidatus Omnitrophota bacterium]MBU2064194.1 hypothetical protein [Candidatus Omnitrophota bacterium]
MDKNMKLVLIFGSVILALVLVWVVADSFRSTTGKAMLKNKGAGADFEAKGKGSLSGTNYDSAANAPLGTKAQVQAQGRKHSYYFPKVERKVVRTFEPRSELDDLYSDKIEDVSGQETIDGVAPLSEKERLQLMQVAPSVLVVDEPEAIEKNAEKKTVSQNLRQALLDAGMEEPDGFLEHAPPELLEVLEREITQKQQ